MADPPSRVASAACSPPLRLPRPYPRPMSSCATAPRCTCDRHGRGRAARCARSSTRSPSESRWLRFFSGRRQPRPRRPSAASARGGAVAGGRPRPRATTRRPRHVRPGDATGPRSRSRSPTPGRGAASRRSCSPSSPRRPPRRASPRSRAIVLPENHRMIGVFRDSGFPVEVRTEPGELEVEFPTALRRTAGGASRSASATAAVAAVAHVLRPASVAVDRRLAARPARVGGAVLRNLAPAASAAASTPSTRSATTIDGVPALPLDRRRPRGASSSR